MASSTFTGVENPLSEGGIWTSGPGFTTDYQKTGGAASGTGAGWNGAIYVGPFAGGINQYSEVLITALEGGPCVRMQSAVDSSCYLADFDGNNYIRLFRVTDTGSLAFLQLGGLMAATGIAGSTIRIEARDDIIEVFKNGISIGARSDTTFSNGNAAIMGVGVAGGVFDTWSGGTLAVPVGMGGGLVGGSIGLVSGLGLVGLRFLDNQPALER